MKKSVMKKWVKALRSGKYRQTRGQLKGKYGYCCLGVLCDISGKGKWNNDSCWPTYDLSHSTLPDSVMNWSGIKTWNAEYKVKHKNGTFKKKTLAELNDLSKMNFKQIAKIIEKVWKQL